MAASISHDPAAEAPAPANPASRLWLWKGLALLLTLVALTHLASKGWEAFHDLPDRGSVQADFANACIGDEPWCVVASVTPGGAMDQAGVQAGDRVRFDRPSELVRISAPSEQLGFTLRRGDTVRHAVVFTRLTHPSEAETSGSAGLRLTLACIGLLSALLGIFLIARSRRELAPILLAIAFLCSGLDGSTQTAWESQSPFFSVFILRPLLITMVNSYPLWLLAFAIQFRSESQRGRSAIDGAISPKLTKWWRIFIGYAVINIITAGLGVWYFNTRSLDGNSVLLAVGASVQLGLILTFAQFYSGWRNSIQDMQRRYTVMLVAISVTALVTVFGGTNQFLYDDWSWGSPLVLLQLACGICGPLLFAYAVLRHKVLDLGFAINRTLIYGTISAGLLVLFGLIEWGTKKLLPHEAMQASVVINAGAALTIFLVFHRIHHFVEHHVERLLFRSWHDNEAKLRKFVKEAAFIGKPEALVAASVAALSRFAGGAVCALYLRDGEDYVSGGARIDGDDPMAVTLRADHKPLELVADSPTPSGEGLGWGLSDTRDVADEGQTPPPAPPLKGRGARAALALPMTHRGQLDGFILLGAKPSGDSYRPDVIELLGWAAQQIGLDLHALKVMELKRDNASLQVRLHEVQGLLVRAQTAGAQNT